MWSTRARKTGRKRQRFAQGSRATRSLHTSSRAARSILSCAAPTALMDFPLGPTVPSSTSHSLRCPVPPPPGRAACKRPTYENVAHEKKKKCVVRLDQEGNVWVPRTKQRRSLPQAGRCAVNTLLARAPAPVQSITHPGHLTACIGTVHCVVFPNRVLSQE